MMGSVCVFLGLVAVSLIIPHVPAHPARIVSRRQDEPVCGYQSCPVLDPGKLNVHMVPHTHDDAGWLKTVDQYYYGARTGIQRAGVQYIIDSFVRELLLDPSKRFVYVETAFLWRWWQEADDARREEMRGLVNSGQLEIIGGAWSMNDEAAAHYHSIIDQFTWGLRILNDTLGECARPRVGWQIDPFGHSREMASIFARMGYDGLFFGRLDYQDKGSRLSEKTAEMIWRGSPDNIGSDSDLFTQALYNHYSPPPGFCFDVLCQDEPMIDNKRSPEYNIPDRVNKFLAFVNKQANSFKTNNIILTMGEDFHYQDANMWFKNMDKVIKYVNAEQSNGSLVNVFYSTPSCYLKAVNEAGISWPTKEDDFFPYASDESSYWTGYFTSKPTIKQFERLGNNFLQVCKQVASLARTSDEDNVGVTALREAMGVMQHHDAITGTMKAHVANDYSRLLYDGIDQCGDTAEVAINKMMGNTDENRITVTSCLKLNISECAISENSEQFVVTVWNPLSHSVSHYVRLPVLGSKYSVQDSNSTVAPSELIPIPDSVLTIPGRESGAIYDLVFRAQDIPPLGYRSYHVSRPELFRYTSVQYRDITISNGGITLTLDDTGLTKSISMNGAVTNVRQSFRYYDGMESLQGRSSGAYIFRPKEQNTTDIPITSFTVHKGDLVEEVHQVFGDGWVSQVIRLYKDEDHVEFEWMVGPIPGLIHGKEVISLYETDLQSNSTFYTDSNGREMLKRVRNFRPTWNLTSTEPISSNYYPVTSKILIRDQAKQQEVAVLVDRAEGGSSIRDGQIELMLHRRLLVDDGFGVDEALNEEAYEKGLVARGKHYLVAGSLSVTSPTLAMRERLVAQRKLLVPWTFLSPTELSHAEWINKYKMEFSSILNDALPSYVQILTLEPWKENSLLLRLENILEKSDDPSLPSTATVNLKELFSSYSPIVVTGFRETSLAGNQFLEEVERLSWLSKFGSHANLAPWRELDDTAVTLGPMQIRTFVVDMASEIR